jgi:hypothetical protein
MKQRIGTVTLAASTMLTIACGPTSLMVNPARVVNVNVQPASGQAFVLPGRPVPDRASSLRFDDGTLCSNMTAGAAA